MRISLLLFLLGTSLSLLAQSDQEFVIDHTITSAAFGDERKITVYLPPAYYKRPGIKYTVTYVLDGHYSPFIDLVVKAIEYNVNARKITPTIVVGIHAKNRGAEFSMPQSADEPQDKRAPALQAHLRDEVFPLIESLYPTAADYRSIIGHSSGGKFVLLTLFSKASDLFNGYLAISPALRPGQQTILEQTETQLAAGARFPKFLYCSAGTVGEREFLFGGAVDRLDALLQKYPEHGLIWQQDRFEGLDHWSVVAPSVVGGCMAQTRAFRADVQVVTRLAQAQEKDLTEQLDQFYATNEATYGFSDLPSAGYLNLAVEELIRLEMPEKALQLYEWALERYPDHFTLTKYQGLLQQKLGEKTAARASYQKSLRILESQKADLDDEEYQAKKQNIQERIKKLGI
ncbi:MAG: alpha/beta hydrolase-fold protein [Bacteroidota bacterium]